MALGLGDRLAALSQLQPNAALTLQDILHRREALHTLMDFNPTQMGTFGVLVQGKGLTPPQSDLRSLKAV
jgi:SAM-dependent MidA family methyltransferase